MRAFDTSSYTTLELIIRSCALGCIISTLAFAMKTCDDFLISVARVRPRRQFLISTIPLILYPRRYFATTD